MEVFQPAVLNKMLLARAQDLATKRPAASREALKSLTEQTLPTLQKALGLFPMPPRPKQPSKVTGTLEGDGYRSEKLWFESRPGVHVPSHLYLPAGEGPFPAIVYLPDAEWTKSTPWVQSAGIGLALLGFAVLILDPLEAPERADLGNADDPRLLLGAPAAGQLVWDAVRALDYAESRKDLRIDRCGIAGVGSGGLSAIHAFALDPRFNAGVFSCALASLEASDMPECLRKIPGILQAGDFSDILATRAPAPVMLFAADGDATCQASAHDKTFQKLRASYKSLKADQVPRIDHFSGPRDFNRRMRESMYAFFSEHLTGVAKADYIPELRPLTDGAQTPAPGGTRTEDDPDLKVGVKSKATYQSVLEKALEEPYPAPFVETERMPGWGRYGKISAIPGSEEIRLSDTDALESVLIPTSGVDASLAALGGLSVPEFYAQLLHQMIPGGPQGWEQTALTGGHALTSMFASVKTLVAGATPVVEAKRVFAYGPIASATALFLGLLRPDAQVHTSHHWDSWEAMVADGIVQPQARYLKFPFPESHRENGENTEATSENPSPIQSENKEIEASNGDEIV